MTVQTEGTAVGGLGWAKSELIRAGCERGKIIQIFFLKKETVIGNAGPDG